MTSSSKYTLPISASLSSLPPTTSNALIIFTKLLIKLLVTPLAFAPGPAIHAYCGGGEMYPGGPRLSELLISDESSSTGWIYVRTRSLVSTPALDSSYQVLPTDHMCPVRCELVKEVFGRYYPEHTDVCDPDRCRWYQRIK